MKIFWSQESEKNLLEIVEYLSRGSPARAVQLIEKIKSKTSSLKRFPKIGRMVPELFDRTPLPRELHCDNYRIVYHSVGKRIEIITVFHGMKRFPYSKV